MAGEKLCDFVFHIDFFSSIATISNAHHEAILFASRKTVCTVAYRLIVSAIRERMVRLTASAPNLWFNWWMVRDLNDDQRITGR